MRDQDSPVEFEALRGEVAAMRSELRAHAESVFAALARIEAKLADGTGLLERAETAERRLRELGEQCDELVRALSEARRWLRERPQ